MHKTKWLLLGMLTCVGSALASEGDLLIDVGPQAVFRTYTGYESPMIGGTVSVLKGFNDQTDIGLSVAFDHANGLLKGPDQNWTTVALQSWYTAYNGDIRPQMGGSVGVTMDGEGNAMFHLAARARGLMELSTSFRLYAGGAVGGDVGDAGSSFVKAEFGAQFLLP